MWRGSYDISELLQTCGETRRRDAALNTRTCEIVGSLATWRTRDESVACPHPVVDTQARRRVIHIIVDTLSALTTQKVRTFLAADRTVRLH